MNQASSMQARRAELLDDVVSQTEVVIEELGLTPDVAKHLGHALADHLVDHWGGQVLSFPKDAAYKLSQRERQILREHREGTPVSVLAQRYSMTMRGLRKLLQRARVRDVHLDQGVLDLKAPE